MTTDVEAMLAPGQVARRLGVSDQMVRDWMKTGRLPAVRTALGRLIHPDDVDRLIEERRRRQAARAGKDG